MLNPVFSLITFISIPDFFKFLAIDIALLFSPCSLFCSIPSIIPCSLAFFKSNSMLLSKKYASIFLFYIYPLQDCH